jgi:hypothetical protein
MGSLTLIGGTIVIAMALTKNTQSTVELTVAVITIRGVTFLCQKLVGSLNKEHADVINLVGWAVAARPVIQILKLAKESTIFESLLKTTDSLTRLGDTFSRIGDILEKITFWN